MWLWRLSLRPCEFALLGHEVDILKAANNKRARARDSQREREREKEIKSMDTVSQLLS